MAAKTVTVEAIYEDGVLRPVPPLPLAPHQRVTVTVEMPTEAAAPPELPALEPVPMDTPFEAVPESWDVSER
jgi:predicted DNA-binding antitoxin AbrB/MazE fold protein